MSTATIGVAVVGLGIAGGEHLLAFAQHSQAEIAAICDLREDFAQAKADELGLCCPIYASYEDCLADPAVDAVVLATPNNLHCQQIIQAANAGKATLVEKPAALSGEELDEIEEALQATGARCYVNMILRWHPLFETALAHVRGGALGDIYYVEAEMLYGELEIPEPDWEKTVAGGRNIQLAVGCHAYDQVLRFANQAVREVGGFSTRRSQAWEFDPVSTVVIHFENDVFGRVTTNLEAQMPYQFNLRVFGTGGTIINNSICLPGEWGAEFRPLTDAGVDVDLLPFDRSADAFLNSLRGNGAAASFADARPTFDLAIAADQACQHGQSIQLR